MNPFLERFGFQSDPFEFTNAEQEQLLDKYFVPPPYFAAVLGDPANPRADIVFAPRGGGKTAQRLMIERDSERRGSYLCVRYDSFPQPAGFRLDSVDLSYHVAEICKLILVGVLVYLEDDPDKADRLTPHQKSVLKFQTSAFLGTLSAEEFRRALSSVKTFGEKAVDLWNRYSGPLAAALEIILKRLGLENVEVPHELLSETRRDESLRYHLSALSEIVRALGFGSVYVLIDKVDELAATGNDVDATFRFIRPLLVDLPTLEAPGLAFKFFLWDRVQESYLAAGGRPDRIQMHGLEWSVEQLETMLKERLQAHSLGKIESLNQLLCKPVELNLHRLVALMAGGSPRDMIRTAKRIIGEQTRVTTADLCLTDKALWAGIGAFALERAKELVPRATDLDQLRRVGTPTFTVNRLANDIFRITTQGARNKVQNWMAAGFATKIGELPNTGNRPLHLYGVTDLRVAIAMRPGMNSEELLAHDAFICESCASVALSAEAEHTCVRCGHHFSTEGAASVLEHVTL